MTLKSLSSESLLTLANIIGFQLSWLACVIGGSVWGAVTVALFLLWHLRCLLPGEWRLMTVLTGVGVLMDTLLYHLGVLQFPGYEGGLIPIWLMLLWLAFTATLLHSLQVMFVRPWLIGLVAAVSAPLSYYAGSRLGAVDLSEYGVWIIGLSWGLLMLCAALLYRYKAR